ncbi:multidrug transporter MatE [Oceanicola sp. 22II-s10i]|uniref:MATE family efflux transporter n=1 Tax=Oceanicola sp. 22II-s10i TaxID=1317116 RepID=UPI000B527771|nr:MATE family efflux transporter [Oceanicola sp. 22II-s10i]OWU85086.1 multidrug transporter MatE [Oceanicola sp. 22II-s10i]
MTNFSAYRTHARAILSLGLPLVGSQIAQVGVQVVDTIMLGWYDVEALAGVVLGSTLFFILFIAGCGFAWAVTPLVAEAEGRGDTTTARRMTRMSLWLTILYALAVLPVLLMAEQVMLLLGQNPKLAAMAGDYLAIYGWGIFPALGVMVLKSFLSALERTRVVFWITLLAVGVNALGNHVFIFGNYGVPELGVRGAAISSIIVQVVSLGGLVLYIQRTLPEQELFRRFWRADWEAFGTIFRLGWPIGLTTLSEVGLFAASALMMGWIGTLPLAAHGIAIQIVSLTFMVHLGLANTATIRAGRAIGRGDRQGLRDGAVAAVMLSGVFALVTVAFFLAIPGWLIGLFVDPNDPVRDEVIAAGRYLLVAGALFQTADAAQVMALGLLRGAKDTRVPMVLAAVSYWVIGLPCGYLLAFVAGWGGVGLWLGLAAGLGAAGVTMMIRFWRHVLPRAIPDAV